MKNILVSGLAAALVAGGLGLAAGPSQASPTPTTTTRAASGSLPLALDDLLGGVTTALNDLLGMTPADGSAQLQAVEDLVDEIVATLTGAAPADQTELADAIAARLQDAQLDPAVLAQVLTGLSESDQLPTSALSAVVDGVLTSVQDLVRALLGIGGQQPDPALVQEFLERILQALAAGDTADLRDVVSDLLTSLPGGTGLSAATLDDLVNQVVAALQEALAGGTSPTIIGTVTDGLNGAPAAAAPAASATPVVSSPGGFSTNKRPTIRGRGTAGATVSVRSSTGTVLGSTTVTSAGTFTVKSRTLKVAKYTVRATQVEPGRAASAPSATRTFRVVSAKPVITTKSKKSFKTSRPKITGIGYPKSKIVLKSSTGKKLGSTKVRSDGTWTIKSKKLSKGTRKVKAVQTGHGKKKTTKSRTIRIR